MHPFRYERPATLDEAIALLERHGGDARLLAGGTDLIIGLRDRSESARVVVDVKHVAELRPGIAERDGVLAIAATTVMTDIAANARVGDRFVALAEAAAVVGSVQIRNRATLGGNICNASPAADTATPLLVYGAVVVVAGRGGVRRIPIDEFFVGPGATTLLRGEIVTAVELPLAGGRVGAAHLRRTRRRGHDLASVTLSSAVDGRGVVRIAYGSVGPRPVLAIDESGVLADPSSSDDARAARLERMLSAASPSPRSMRASPEYRLAMLRVLAARAVARAAERLVEQSRASTAAPPRRVTSAAGPAPADALAPAAGPARAARPRTLPAEAATPSSTDADDDSPVAIAMVVNGRERRLEVPAHRTLLEALRDDLGLTGAKECCLVGECGACTVIVDGRTVDACLVLTVEADGADVRTVEGLAEGGRLSRLQEAFLEKGAAQCGYCIPGQLMSARSLLDLDPRPTLAAVQEGLAGNLCRCGGYRQIEEAILSVADEDAR